MNVLSSYAVFVAGVRVVLLYAAVVLAVVCAVDWAVRTRRISPFSRIARFFRARVDPLMVPVERVILRAGGTPSSAAWWTLVGLILFGILLITLLQFAGGILTQVVFGINEPRSIPLLLVSWAFSILRLALLVRVISSWLPISPYSRWLRWSYVLTEWMIAPLRRIIPLIGMIDITPIIAWFLLNLIQSALGIP
ncbi:MAG TPA: YggT family protein [Gemmatimonadaceae bacterium]|nr:YggT family protein [Gemmatimonadaceae bacterium]